MSKKIEGRLRRKQRIRKKISGTAERPRLTIYRSLNHIYCQVIDDVAGKTIVAASTKEKGSDGRSNKASAVVLGQRIAEKAKDAKVGTVIFDRNGYIYHGCVKAFADAAREAGLQF